MAQAPEAIGPVSKTVVGDSPSVATELKKTASTPVQWKKFLVPAGIAGLIFLALRYKGHV